jgi:uncharacterized membrane protein
VIDRTVADGRLEARLARVLQVGTYLSLALVATGAALLLLGGGSPLDGAPLLDLGRLPADLGAGRPEGFLWLGVLGVIATPALRVVGALVGFVRGREWRMAGVAVGIIIVVGLGIAAGLVTG